jgi:hypothetical protein
VKENKDTRDALFLNNVSLALGRRSSSDLNETLSTGREEGVIASLSLTRLVRYYDPIVRSERRE